MLFLEGQLMKDLKFIQVSYSGYVDETCIY